jgi:hypothetical protein
VHSVHTSKYFSNNFPIQNGLKQGDALSPLIFNFALEYSIRKVQKNLMGLKLNGTHQFLAYVDDGNLPGDNMDTSFPAFYETRRFNTEFTRALRLFLS